MDVSVNVEMDVKEVMDACRKTAKETLKNAPLGGSSVVFEYNEGKLIRAVVKFKNQAH